MSLFNIQIQPAYSMPITPTTEFPVSRINELLAEYIPFDTIEQIPSAEGNKFYLQILSEGTFALTISGNTQNYLDKVASSGWKLDPSFAQFASPDYPQVRYISPLDTIRIVISSFKNDCFEIQIETYSSKPAELNSWPAAEVNTCLGFTSTVLQTLFQSP